MFFPPEIAHVVAAMIYLADHRVRLRLTQGLITRGENQYTSDLVAQIQNLSFPSEVEIHAVATTPTNEQLFGCDILMLFEYAGEFKVGLAESKLPRSRATPGHRWDYTHAGRSHFAGQLDRQHRWTEHAAIWEMFYDETPQTDVRTLRDGRGSTCAWHKEAYSFQRQRANPDAAWNDADLEGLFTEIEREFRRNGGWNLREIILRILNCTRGRRLSNLRNGRVMLPDGQGENVHIPIPRARETANVVETFMQRNGLSAFIHVNGKRPSSHTEE